MATFQSSAFIESFRSRGVRREAFGTDDLRAWAGAIPDVKSGVRASVAALLSAPFLPQDIEVAGLILDDTTGALEVVHRPGDAIVAPGAGVIPARTESAAAASKTAPTSVSTAPPPLPPKQAVAAVAGSHTAGASGHSVVNESPAHAAGAGIPAMDPSMTAPSDLIGAIQELRGFVKNLEDSAFWRHELKRLRQEMGREQSLLARLTLIDTFVRKAAAQSRQVAAAYDRLKRESASARQGLSRDMLVELFRRSAGER
jgi:hypothetical protein